MAEQHSSAQDLGGWRYWASDDPQIIQVRGSAGDRSYYIFFSGLGYPPAWGSRGAAAPDPDKAVWSIGYLYAPSLGGPWTPGNHDSPVIWTDPNQDYHTFPAWHIIAAWVVDSDDGWLMALESAAGRTWIGVCEATRFPDTWAHRGLVLEGPPHGELNSIADPCLVFADDGHWRLFYSKKTGTNWATMQRRASSSGRTLAAGLAGWGDEQVAIPEPAGSCGVCRAPDGWYMAVARPLAGTNNIFLAFRPSLASGGWTVLNGGRPIVRPIHGFDAEGCQDPSIYYERGSFYISYAGVSDPGNDGHNRTVLAIATVAAAVGVRREQAL